MDVLDETLIRFWKSLNDHHVKYIMIGGFATRFHGFNRSTDDLNIWLDDTLENRKNLRKAFIEIGYGDFELIETMEFYSRMDKFSYRQWYRTRYHNKYERVRKYSI